MKGKIIFEEAHGFRGTFPWYMAIIFTIPMCALFAWGLYVQLVIGEPWGDKPMSDTGLIAVSIISIVVTVGVAFFIDRHKLLVQIDEDSIRYRFKPYLSEFKEIGKHDVKNIYPRKYRPIAEYGGWGNRGFGSNKAYNIWGNKGLQIELHDGKKLLLGTQKYEELSDAVIKLRERWGMI